MSSKQKRKIARQNGAQAAGSKSPEGIQKSSMNAMRHGLTAKALVLTNESLDQFTELHKTYREKFQPQDGVETDLIDQMVAAQWRLRRIWSMQTAALDLKMDQQEAEIAEKFTSIDQPTRATVAFTTLANEEKSLELLLRYEITYTRMYDRAQKALLRLRNENLLNDPNTDPPEPETPAPATPSASNSIPASPNTAPPSIDPPHHSAPANQDCSKSDLAFIIGADRSLNLGPQQTEKVLIA
jgi:hypothetical protein